GKRYHIPPAFGQAAVARELDLKPGDRVVATTDPDHPEGMKELKPLPNEGTTDYAELVRRMARLAGRPTAVGVVRRGAGTPQRVELARALRYGASLVAPPPPGQRAAPYDPYDLKPLPPVEDPQRPTPRYDPYEFSKRLQDLASRPMVVQ